MKARTRTTALVMLLALCGTAYGQSYSGAPQNFEMGGYGQSILIGDGTIYIAEIANSYRPGMLYAYQKDTAGNWAEVGRVTASNAETGDRFGAGLAMSGNRMIVSATQRDNERGAAYIFEEGSDGSWSEVAMLMASDAEDEDRFGASVAIDGDWAIVTSTQKNDRAGAAYVFQRTASGAWTQHATLMGTDVGRNDRFGTAVALKDGMAFVSAPRVNSSAGAVFVFKYDADSNSWMEEGMITGGDVESGNRFGSSMSLRDGHLLVGAPFQNGYVGAAYLFAWDDEEAAWKEQQKIVPFDGARQNRFGTSLAYDNGNMLIGSPGAMGFQGTAYLIEMDEGMKAWTGMNKLMSADLSGGDFFAGALDLRGNLAVVGAVNDDFGSGSVMIFERDASGMWKQVNTLVGEYDGLASETGGKVSCEDGQASHFDCQGVDMLSFMSVEDLGGGRGVRVNDIWGWTDPDTNREYALVGRINGTSFVDVTNPENPVFIGDLPLTEGANPNSWRDVKVYQNHAYIVADNAGEHGMQVFDLTQLRSAEAPATFTETTIYRGIHSAHNVVINEDTGYAYIVGSSGGGESCGGGLHMVNIQEPANPTFAGCFSDPTTGRASTGYSHDAQCVIYKGPDVEHQGKEICLGANETALSIADVTDKENPIALSTGTYPNVGYTHQGWLTEDHRYFYINDELDELQGKVDGTRTLIWDLTDLDDPQLVKEHYGTTKSSDHNLYVLGNLMYQSNYVSGLRVLDISDVNNPVEVGYFDTVPHGENTPGFDGSWSNYPYFKSGIVIVTSGGEGLFILKKRDVDI